MWVFLSLAVLRQMAQHVTFNLCSAVIWRLLVAICGKTLENHLRTYFWGETVSKAPKLTEPNIFVCNLIVYYNFNVCDFVVHDLSARVSGAWALVFVSKACCVIKINCASPVPLVKNLFLFYDWNSLNFAFESLIMAVLIHCSAAPYYSFLSDG